MLRSASACGQRKTCSYREQRWPGCIGRPNHEFPSPVSPTPPGPDIRIPVQSPCGPMAKPVHSPCRPRAVPMGPRAVPRCPHAVLVRSPCRPRAAPVPSPCRPRFAPVPPPCRPRAVPAPSPCQVTHKSITKDHIHTDQLALRDPTSRCNTSNT